MPFAINYKFLKLLLTLFLAGYTVAMVNKQCHENVFTIDCTVFETMGVAPSKRVVIRSI